MNDLMDFFSENYYTSLLLIITGIIAIPIAIKHRKKFSILKFMPVYLGFSVLQSLFNCLIITKFNSDSWQWFYNTNDSFIFLFLAIEVLIFGSLLRVSISNTLITKSIKLFIPLFSAFIIFFILFIPEKVKFFTTVYTVETTFLLIPCIFYYFEKLLKTAYFNPSDDPAFWVITGLTLFLITTLPYILIQDYIMEIDVKLFDRMQTLMYGTYCLFFFLIIRAYFCRRSGQCMVMQESKIQN